MLMQAFDQLSTLFGRSVLKRTLDSHCRIVTAAGEHEFVADDGSIVTVCRLDGLRSMAGEAELSGIVERLRIGLSGYFGDAGHTLQFWFGHSPALARNEVDRAMNAIEDVAKDSGLDVADVVAERRQRLPERLSGERAFVALWSRPGLLQKQEAKQSAKQMREAFKGAPQAAEAQMPGVGAEALLVRHRSVAQALVRAMSEVGVESRALEVHEAMGAMKAIADPNFGPAESTWRGVLPGDKLRSRMAERPAELKSIDVSNVLLPLIGRQLLCEHAEVLDQTTCRIGDYVWSSFDVTMPPEVIVSFNDLVRRTLEPDDAISWRVSMIVNSGGFQGQVFKEQVARATQWATATTNQRIRDAFEHLHQANGDGDTVVRWSASFAVWCLKTDEAKLVHHVAAIRRAVERWGNTQTDAMIGDPIEGTMSSTMGLTATSTGPVASASLTDVLAMSPISRPASPWAQGTMMFRTDDGKAWKYQPGSSKQLSWVDLMVGTPGSGKSVLLNSLNLGVALSRQTGRSASNRSLLPRIAIIDIGRSSEGLIQLIRDALPVDRRHEAVFHRLRMDEAYSVNPFDTQLGLRRPLAHERGYLVNLVCLICTPEGETKPYDGISALAAAAIDAVYEECADGGTPKRYVASEVRAIDEAIEAIGHEVDENTTWWEVTDALAGAGRFHEASLAQRQAVPTLVDLVEVVNKENVQVPFSGMNVANGQTVVKAFQRIVTSATRDYPILARPTRFDVSSARVVAFDLADVTAKVGPQAAKQTAIMYMLARQTVTHDFWLDVDEVRALRVPPIYRERLIEQAETNKQMPKRLCFDEYHLTGGLGIRDQVIQDVRVGRKQGVQIALASQLIEDFDQAIQELASNVWFCNVPTEGSISRICETYNLSDAVRVEMRKLNGPVAGLGAPVLAFMKLKSGTFVQRIINELGPVELWALSTTAEDTALRTMLYERLGPKEARRRLAARFPSGSAKDMIERRLVELEERSVKITDKERGDVVKTLADDLVGVGS